MSAEQVQRLRAAIPDDAECVVAIYPDGDVTVVRSFNMTYEQLIDLLHRSPASYGRARQGKHGVG